MTEIKDWLAGERPYTEGVNFYVKYGKNPALKRFFLIKDNDYAKEKLVYELSKIVAIEYVPPVDETESSLTAIDSVSTDEDATTAVKYTAEQVIPPSVLINQDYPEELATMILERQALTNKKGKIANSLGSFAQEDNEGRKGVMDEIQVIRERINEINEAERYFIKNKKMPEKTAHIEKFHIMTSPIPTDKAELLSWKKKLTELRSKSKSKLKNIGEGSEEGQRLAVKITKINERYEAVEKLLSAGQ